METKIIKAVFGGGTSTVTNKRTRTDYGQVLEIIGIDLPDTFECIFSNSSTSAGVGKKMIGSNQRVLIPDEYLATGQTIYAWVLVHDSEDDGRHMYSVRIPVADMPDTSPEEPTPVEQSVISQAIAALNDAVTQTGQDVIDADASAQAAQAAQTAAESARDAAQASETAASQSESNAAAAASSANQSATNAAASELSARTSATSAARDADRAEQAAGQSGYMAFWIDSNGDLIYERTSNVDVDFRLVDGDLILEAV